MGKFFTSTQVDEAREVRRATVHHNGASQVCSDELLGDPTVPRGVFKRQHKLEVAVPPNGSLYEVRPIWHSFCHRRLCILPTAAKTVHFLVGARQLLHGHCAKEFAVLQGLTIVK